MTRLKEVSSITLLEKLLWGSKLTSVDICFLVPQHQENLGGIMLILGDWRLPYHLYFFKDRNIKGSN